MYICFFVQFYVWKIQISFSRLMKLIIWVLNYYSTISITVIDDYELRIILSIDGRLFNFVDPLNYNSKWCKKLNIE